MISDEQVQNLVYHQQAKSKLFEVTHGDPDAVGDKTVTDVLDRFEAELQEPVRLEVASEQAARKKAEEERDLLHGEVKSLQDWRSVEEGRIERRSRARAKARAVAGYVGICLVIGLAAGIVFVIRPHGRLAWSCLITIGIFLAACSWAWGARRSWKVPFGVLVFAGAVTALFVNVWSVIPEG